MILKKAHDVNHDSGQLGTMHRAKNVLLKDVNSFLICTLCKGYFVDATTIIECLHSFCRSCIVQYLEKNKYCPVCDVQVHKNKPLLNIRQDKTLQDIVYKLVPKLFQNEMQRRRDFYSEHPEAKPSPSEENENTNYQHLLSPDETICISLNYHDKNSTPRYLKCPAGVSVAHLQKLIRAKYDLSEKHRVDVLYNQDSLHSYLTLVDIACIYVWRRKGPLELTYRIYENTAKRLKLDPNFEKENESSAIQNLNNNDWKEVQLRITENGEMCITGVQDSIEDIMKEHGIIQKSEKMDVVPENTVEAPPSSPSKQMRGKSAKREVPALLKFTEKSTRKYLGTVASRVSFRKEKSVKNCDVQESPTPSNKKSGKEPVVNIISQTIFTPDSEKLVLTGVEEVTSIKTGSKFSAVDKCIADLDEDIRNTENEERGLVNLSQSSGSVTKKYVNKNLKKLGGHSKLSLRKSDNCSGDKNEGVSETSCDETISGKVFNASNNEVQSFIQHSELKKVNDIDSPTSIKDSPISDNNAKIIGGLNEENIGFLKKEVKLKDDQTFHNEEECIESAKTTSKSDARASKIEQEAHNIVGKSNKKPHMDSEMVAGGNEMDEFSKSSSIKTYKVKTCNENTKKTIGGLVGEKNVKVYCKNNEKPTINDSKNEETSIEPPSVLPDQSIPMEVDVSNLRKRKLESKNEDDKSEPLSKLGKPTILNHTLGLLSNNHPLKKHSQWFKADPPSSMQSLKPGGILEKKEIVSKVQNLGQNLSVAESERLAQNDGFSEGDQLVKSDLKNEAEPKSESLSKSEATLKNDSDYKAKSKEVLKSEGLVKNEAVKNQDVLDRNQVIYSKPPSILNKNIVNKVNNNNSMQKWARNKMQGTAMSYASKNNFGTVINVPKVPTPSMEVKNSHNVIQDDRLKLDIGSPKLPSSLTVTSIGGNQTQGTTVGIHKNLSGLPSSPVQKPQNQVSINATQQGNNQKITTVEQVAQKMVLSKPKSNTTMGYKTLRDPPKSWNPQISRANLTKLQQNDPKYSEAKSLKPAKFFKMRNNMPRYLGNPASGVKPMYAINASPEKEKNEAAAKEKVHEIKKHSIVTIDPKTLKPITERAPDSSNLTSPHSDLKINTSSVSIFNPLKLQNTPKNESRLSPKSPLSPSKSTAKTVKSQSPPVKREKLNLNFTPSNPFIPNLGATTLNPNQFLFPGAPGFPSYDPRVMAAYHSFFYGQRMGFPNAALPGLNLDMNQRKSYDLAASTSGLISPNSSKNQAPNSPINAMQNAQQIVLNFQESLKNAQIKNMQQKSSQNLSSATKSLLDSTRQQNFAKDLNLQAQLQDKINDHHILKLKERQVDTTFEKTVKIDGDAVGRKAEKGTAVSKENKIANVDVKTSTVVEVSKTIKDKNIGVAVNDNRNCKVEEAGHKNDENLIGRETRNSTKDESNIVENNRNIVQNKKSIEKTKTLIDDGIKINRDVCHNNSKIMTTKNGENVGFSKYEHSTNITVSNTSMKTKEEMIRNAIKTNIDETLKLSKNSSLSETRPTGIAENISLASEDLMGSNLNDKISTLASEKLLPKISMCEEMSSMKSSTKESLKKEETPKKTVGFDASNSCERKEDNLEKPKEENRNAETPIKSHTVNTDHKSVVLNNESKVNTQECVSKSSSILLNSSSSEGLKNCEERRIATSDNQSEHGSLKNSDISASSKQETNENNKRVLKIEERQVEDKKEVQGNYGENDRNSSSDKPECS